MRPLSLGGFGGQRHLPGPGKGLEPLGGDAWRARGDGPRDDPGRGGGGDVRGGPLAGPPGGGARTAPAGGGDAGGALATLEAAASVPAADAGGVRRIDQTAV